MSLQERVDAFMGYKLKSGRKYPRKCIACGGMNDLPHESCDRKQDKMRQRIEQDLGLL